MADRGMGKGLGAILGSTAVLEASGTELRELPVGSIDPNPSQPRKQFDSDSLAQLADSVGERGVLQPVLVRPGVGGRYELVAGERRWRAAQIAGLKTVPAVIADRDDSESLEAAVIENMARQDLNPIEEARAIATLVEDAGLTREAVGKRVGRSRSAISNLLRILDLPQEAVELIESGVLSEGHGKALLLAEDHATRRSLARDAAAHGWSVRMTEDKARASNRDASAPKGASRPQIHPDAQAAADQISDRIAAALGVGVKVRVRGNNFSAQLELGDVEEALALVNRMARLPQA
ncbi:MAG TPA: ParB/RepB/Spo0J family partition protein [Baekduia sp.]|nr:ParB/RepB/Spo0J family partition protein [Baekduia sp.]